MFLLSFSKKALSFRSFKKEEGTFGSNMYYTKVMLNFQIINFNWKFVAFYIILKQNGLFFLDKYYLERKIFCFLEWFWKYTWRNFELNYNGYICSLEFIPKKKQNSSGHGSNNNRKEKRKIPLRHYCICITSVVSFVVVV